MYIIVLSYTSSIYFEETPKAIRFFFKFVDISERLGWGEITVNGLIGIENNPNLKY